MVINLSNHPSNKWSVEQKEVAKRSYGSIVDLAFPAIDPGFDKEKVILLAKAYLSDCHNYFNKENLYPKAVHIMGEHTFVFILIIMLQQNDIKCISSTTRRKAQDLGEGLKTSEFSFVRFREYPHYSKLVV